MLTAKVAELNNLEENMMKELEIEERTAKDINKGLTDLEQESIFLFQILTKNI